MTQNQKYIEELTAFFNANPTGIVHYNRHVGKYALVDFGSPNKDRVSTVELSRKGMRNNFGIAETKDKLCIIHVSIPGIDEDYKWVFTDKSRNDYCYKFFPDDPFYELDMLELTVSK